MEVGEEIAVEGALRLGGVEIDLQGGDSGLVSCGEDCVCYFFAGFVVEDCIGESFDADDGDARGGGRQDQETTAGLRLCDEADVDGSVEVGDGEPMRVDGVQIFAAFPCPERDAGQRGKGAMRMGESVGMNSDEAWQRDESAADRGPDPGGDVHGVAVPQCTGRPKNAREPGRSGHGEEIG